MKTLYSLSLVLFVLVAGTACMSTSQVQDDDNKNFSSIMDSRNYVFVAQSVSPLSGRFRQLTTDYDVRVYGDSVVTYLPYFGRAYSAPVDPTKGGFQFTSTDFEYVQTPRKKGGWNITIRPKDVQDVREMTLAVSAGGNASLQVVSNSRQSISFNGRIEPRK